MSGMKRMTTLLAASVFATNLAPKYTVDREQQKLDRLHEFATHKANPKKKAKRKAVQKARRKNR